MNKKGFTLVEILSVLVLISLLLGLAIPGINKISSNMKKKCYSKKVILVESAAELWGQDNKTLLQSSSDCEIRGREKVSCYKITVGSLIENNYLDSDKNSGEYISPLDNSDMKNQCVYVYKKNNRVYSYFAGEDGKDCYNDNSNTGNNTDDNEEQDTQTEILVDVIINSAKKAKDTNDTVRTVYQEKPTTTPGKEISTEIEKTLSITQDDYGDSYYFRGNIIDNFVNYAGMCWRVVRIEGDKSTKMILASENTCSDTNITTRSGFIQPSAIYGYSNFSKKTNDYVSSPSENENSARTKLNNWYEEKIANNKDITEDTKSLLKKDDWCIGDRVFAYYYDALDNYKLKVGDASDLSLRRYRFYYSAYKRTKIDLQPSLKCDGNKENSGEIDENIVGMLTADEVVFAGAARAANSTYYLNTNSASRWWTLSLNGSDNGYDTAIDINENGALAGDQVYLTYSAIRPTITLRADTKISSGNGTVNNAYTITTN